MSQPLKIRFATDVESAKQGMSSLAASVASNALSMASALKAANDNVQKLQSLLNGMSAARAALLPLAATAVAVAAGLALVSSAISQANAQLDRFITLGDNAERAGVGVEFFQRFSEAAKKAKIDVAEVESALKKAGEGVTPKFEQTDGVKKQLNDLFSTGYLGDFQSKGLADYNAAGSNEDRIRAAVTAMQELQQLGERLAAVDLASKVFGPELADRIRTGKLDIDEIAASLDRQREDLISQAQVEQAKQFREQLDDAYRAIDEALHVSVALEGAGRDILDVWLKIAQGIAEAARLAGVLIDRLAEAKQSSQDTMGELATALGAQAVNRYLFPNQGKTIYSADDPATTPTPVQPPSPPRRPLSVILDEQKVKAPSGGGGKSKTDSETLDAVQTYINGLTRSTAALKAEMEALGKTNIERLTAINLAKAEELARQNNIKLTDEQVAKIRETSKATAEYKDTIEAAHDRQNDLRSIGTSVFQGIRNDFQNGVTGGQAFLNILSRIGDKIGDLAVNGLVDSLFGKSGGTDGGIFGKAFSGLLGSFAGGRAGGGDISAGQWALVGEKGPELIGAAGMARTVIPNGGKLVSGQASAPRGGGTMNYTSAPTYNITPAGGVTPQELRVVLAAHGREMDRTIGQKFSEWRESN